MHRTSPMIREPQGRLACWSSRATRACLFFSLIGALAPLGGLHDAQAWTPQVHQEIARDALALAPRYLQTLLSRHEDAVLRGALGPDGKGTAPFDGSSQDFLATDLPERIAAESARIHKILPHPKNLEEVAYRMGLIAFYTSHAGNPLNTRQDDPKEVYYQGLFQTYVERQLPHIRVVFRGYEPGIMGDLTVRDYLAETCAKAGRFYPSLGSEFIKGGKVQDISRFGPQSVPFAVASVSYNYAVNATVDVWKGVWTSAGGDGTAPDFSQMKGAR